MDYVPGVDGKDDGQPRVLASFMTALMKGEPLVLVDGGEVYRTFCFVDDAVESVVRMIDRPEKSIGHAFNVGNPHNNIQIKELAALMIELYSGLTGKPLGTTRDVAGVDYYGKGYPFSRIRPPHISPHLPTSPLLSHSTSLHLISPHLPFEDSRPSSSLALHASAHHGAITSPQVRGLRPSDPFDASRQVAARLGAGDELEASDGGDDEGLHRKVRGQARVETCSTGGGHARCQGSQIVAVPTQSRSRS